MEFPITIPKELVLILYNFTHAEFQKYSNIKLEFLKLTELAMKYRDKVIVF